MIDNPQNWNQHLRVASLGSIVYGTKFGTEPGLIPSTAGRFVQVGRIRWPTPWYKWGE